MKRPNESDHLLRSNHLLSMYMVDQWAKIESGKLLWLKQHQKELRVDCYASVRDAMLNDGADPSELGRRVILPSTHVGSPRYMNERNQVR